MRYYRNGEQAGEIPALCHLGGKRIDEIRLGAKDVQQLWQAAREKPELLEEILAGWATHFPPEGA